MVATSTATCAFWSLHRRSTQPAAGPSGAAGVQDHLAPICESSLFGGCVLPDRHTIPGRERRPELWEQFPRRVHLRLSRQHHRGVIGRTPPTTTRIEGKLNRRPNRSFTIQFFSDPAPNIPTFFGQGESYPGERTVTTDDRRRRVRASPSRGQALRGSLTHRVGRKSYIRVPGP